MGFSFIHHQDIKTLTACKHWLYLLIFCMSILRILLILSLCLTVKHLSLYRGACNLPKRNTAASWNQTGTQQQPLHLCPVATSRGLHGLQQAVWPKPNAALSPTWFGRDVSIAWQADRVSATPGELRRGCRGDYHSHLASVSNSLWHVGVQVGRSRVYVRALHVLFMTGPEPTREKQLLGIWFLLIFTHRVDKITEESYPAYNVYKLFRLCRYIFSHYLVNVLLVMLFPVIIYL